MKGSSRVVWAAAAGAVAAFAIAGAGAYAAGGNPVEERQAAMKAVGQSMKEAAGYATGQTPYDAAKVKAAMDGIAGNAKKLHGLYPAGSDKDPKTEALPKIWEAKADFDKRLTEMGNLATAAGKTSSVETLKPAFGQLSATCKSCHDVYRKKKS